MCAKQPTTLTPDFNVQNQPVMGFKPPVLLLYPHIVRPAGGMSWTYLGLEDSVWFFINHNVIFTIVCLMPFSRSLQIQKPRAEIRKLINCCKRMWYILDAFMRQTARLVVKR